MISSTVIQMLPEPPPVGGVGGYALALAEELADAGICTRFLVPSPYGDGNRAHRELISERNNRYELMVVSREPGAVRVLSKGDCAILHYVNYGYERRGVPAWLATGIEQSGINLWTNFHEVRAVGLPWQSSFWLCGLQLNIAKRVAKQSAMLSTSLDQYADLIRSAVENQTVKIGVEAVFSTVGEPKILHSLAGRSRRLVVFGGPGVRSRAYGSSESSLRLIIKALALDEIWDIGPGEIAPALFAKIPVKRKGLLPAREISEILSDSVAGLIDYSQSHLAKSTVFAAYAAHGMVVACCGRVATTRERGRSNPIAGEQFWDVLRAGPPSDPQKLGAAAHEWYSPHSLKCQSAQIKKWIHSVGGQIVTEFSV